MDIDIYKKKMWMQRQIDKLFNDNFCYFEKSHYHSKSFFVLSEFIILAATIIFQPNYTTTFLSILFCIKQLVYPMDNEMKTMKITKHT